MIDPDRPFRDQDPLDQNARSGAEGSGVGAWDLDLSTRKLNWSTATRKLFGVGSDAPVDYDLFLSLLDVQDRDHAARAVQESIDTGCTGIQIRVTGYVRLARPSMVPMALLPGSAAS
jgi:two-component system sensor kinase FixL